MDKKTLLAEIEKRIIVDERGNACFTARSIYGSDIRLFIDLSNELVLSVNGDESWILEAK
jgi:hypothetical protein